MKKEISPALIGVALVVILVFAGFFLFRAATAKESYPGADVGPGGGKMPTSKEEGMRMMGKSGIPGAAPGAVNK
jgi:hypothetical protein